MTVNESVRTVCEKHDGSQWLLRMVVITSMPAMISIRSNELVTAAESIELPQKMPRQTQL